MAVPTAPTIDVATASPAELAAYANAQAAANERAAATPIRQEQAATAAQYAAHAKAIQGFATALAALQKGAAPQIQADYTNAGNSQAAYAKGFSDHLQSVLGSSNGDTNAFLSKMGAPDSALKATPNFGDVSYELGGYIPASTMAREGAGFSAAAGLLPGATATKGQQDVAANTAAGEAAQAKYENQIAALAGREPADAAKQLTSLEGVQAKQQTLELSQQKAADARTKTTIGYLLKQTTVDPKTGMVTMAPAIKQQLSKLLGVPASSITGVDASTVARIVQDQITNGFTQQRIGETHRHNVTNEGIAITRVNNQTAPKYSASVSRSLGYRADQYGNPMGSKVTLLPGFGYGKNGDIVKTSTTASTRVHGFSAAQVAKLKGTAITLAENAANGFDDKKGVHHDALDYNQAVLEAQKEGLPAWVYIPALNRTYTSPDSGNPYAYGPAKPTTP